MTTKIGGVIPASSTPIEKIVLWWPLPPPIPLPHPPSRLKKLIFRDLLRKAERRILDVKGVYICPSLAACANMLTLSFAKELSVIIEHRIDAASACTLTTWLVEVGGIPRHEVTEERMRLYRARYIRTLLEEFA